MTSQLALGLNLPDGSSFDNFYAGGNREAVHRLRSLLVESSSPPASIFLSGERASGKSHLLQAACRAAHALGRRSLYAPLDPAALDPRLLADTEDFFLVCIDDVQRIAGDIRWESALFAFWERARESGARLVVSATAAPTHLDLSMPELSTRLAQAPLYALRPLRDSDKLEAVRLRACNRGLDMSLEVARYILSRYPRDLHSLFALLERIDVASLASQRRVTIPFLRELEESGAQN